MTLKVTQRTMYILHHPSMSYRYIPYYRYTFAEYLNPNYFCNASQMHGNWKKVLYLSLHKVNNQEISNNWIEGYLISYSAENTIKINKKELPLSVYRKCTHNDWKSNRNCENYTETRNLLLLDKSFLIKWI